MIITRNNMKIELTNDELRQAWIEYQDRLDNEQRAVYSKRLEKAIAEQLDFGFSKDDFEDLLDECIRDIERHDCDPDWVFGDGLEEIVFDLFGEE